MLVRDSILSLATTAIDAGGAVVVSILIARLLGTRPTGVFGYAQTLASFLLALFGFGIPALLAQRIAEAAPGGRSWLPLVRSGLSVFGSISAPTALVTFGAIWLLSDGKLGGGTAVLAALISAFALAVGGIVLGCDRAQGDFLTPLKVSALTKGALIAAVVATGLLGIGIDGYMIAAAAVQAIVAVGLLRRLQRLVGGDVIGRPRRHDLRTASAAFPFAVLVTLEAVSFRVDTLLVEWMRGGAETGWYVAAYTIYTLPVLVSYAVASAYYPWVTRARASGVGVRRASAVALGAVTVYGLAAAVVCWSLAPWLVRFAFGEAFAPALAPFRILVLSIPVVAANRMGLTDLKGAGRVRAAAIASFAAATVSIAGNVLVLERHGLAGAAWINLLTEIVLLACVGGLGAWRASDGRRSGSA